MKTSGNGIELIKQFEGVRLSCYHLGDGVCTIGYGHTRPLNHCHGEGTWNISQAVADEYLRTDLERYELIINNRFRNLNQNQFDALVSFAYNNGDPFIKDGWSEQARYKPDPAYITEVMMKYVNPPQFREGLTRRRRAEVELFNKPIEEVKIYQIEELKNMQFKYNFPGSGTYAFDGHQILAFTKAEQLALFEGTWSKLNGGKPLPSFAWTKAQHDVWSAMYPTKTVK